MIARLALRFDASMAPSTLVLTAFLAVVSWQQLGAGARVSSLKEQIVLSSNRAVEERNASLTPLRIHTSASGGLPTTLDALLDAIDVMQEEYFQIDAGTWPSSIDWTAAVLGTHISATLSTLVSSIDSSTTTSPITCAETIAWDNLINRYFSHTSAFYFGENALSIRQQAYDDMLWVVLGWLENIKLMDLYSSVHLNQVQTDILQQVWYGTQFKPAAAHRARLFYDLAARGWDTSLCGGGMVWNPHLRPYKNSITNELFISASVSMYLYFPGDDNDSPFLSSTRATQNLKSSSSSTTNSTPSHPHNPQHLQNAIKAYEWLRTSYMTSPYPSTRGLYADGYHITGWHRTPSGRIDPGTGRCDELNTMVYTYNQGVILTGLRGLWVATGQGRYLDDGHDLVEAVVAATGWTEHDSQGGGEGWAGLGRKGVLEEYCDSSGSCSQNGHTFKGIFFHHLAEFCRPLWGAEKKGQEQQYHQPQECVSHADAHFGQDGFDRQTYEYHLYRCKGYRDWIAHNAQASALTRDEEGRFGTWWGRPYPDEGNGGELQDPPPLPLGAVDYANNDHNDDDDGDGGEGVSSVSLHKGILDPDVQNDEPADERVGRKRGRDVNDRGRGRTVETQSGGLAVLRALWQWEAVAAAADSGKKR